MNVLLLSSNGISHFAFAVSEIHQQHFETIVDAIKVKLKKI
jgi:hypothetical protein